MEDLRKVDDNKWWDADNKTLYVRQSARRSDLAGYVDLYREELAQDPDNVSTRFMLAGCLHSVGQTEAACSEWQQVVASGDADWTPLAQEALTRFCREA